VHIKVMQPTDLTLSDRKLAFDAIWAFVWGATPLHPVVLIEAHTYRVTLPDKVVVIRDVSKFSDEMVPWR
jgi:hypothetical protein